LVGGWETLKKIENAGLKEIIEENHKKPIKPKNDFGFMLWKEELNKELLSFWKTITEQYQD
jgi:hypothetical protein